MEETGGKKRNEKRQGMAEGAHKVNQAGTDGNRLVETEGEWAHLEKEHWKTNRHTNIEAITRSVGEETEEQRESGHTERDGGREKGRLGGIGT